MAIAGTLRFGGLTFDTARQSLIGPEGPVELRRKNAEVLFFLLRRAEHVVSKEELIAAVWPDVTVGDDSLTQCISELRRAMGAAGRDLIKTIPRRGYLIDAPVIAAGNDSVPMASPIAVIPDKPSIAVLPLGLTDIDDVLGRFSEGLADDVITELARFSELRVIARNSSFRYRDQPVDIRQVGRELNVRYALCGTARRSARRVRISVQLMQTDTEQCLWADGYERGLGDFFDVQSGIARTVASLLSAHIRKAELARSLLKPPATWQAHDYYLQAAQALPVWGSLGVQELYRTRKLLERCVAADPGHGRALAFLSDTYHITWSQQLDADFLTQAALDRAYEYATAAVRAEPDLPAAHAQLGWELSRRGEHDLAIASFENAVARNASFVDYRYGQALNFAGEPERALAVLQAYRQLDPFQPPIAASYLGLAHYTLKDYAKAEAALRECIVRAPDWRPAHTWLAATYARMGRMGEARQQAAEVLRIQPDFITSKTARRLLTFRRARDRAHMFDALHMAGLPQ